MHVSTKAIPKATQIAVNYSILNPHNPKRRPGNGHTMHKILLYS